MELFEKLPPSLDYKDKFQIIIPCRVAPAFLGRFPNKLEGFVSIRGSSLFSGGKSNNHRYNLCNFQVIMKLTHWALSTFLVLLTLDAYFLRWKYFHVILTHWALPTFPIGFPAFLPFHCFSNKTSAAAILDPIRKVEQSPSFLQGRSLEQEHCRGSFTVHLSILFETIKLTNL